MEERTAEYEFDCLKHVLGFFKPDFEWANSLKGDAKDVAMKELVSMIAFEAEVHLTHFFDVMRLVVKYYKKKQYDNSRVQKQKRVFLGS
jgi:hypothetical protein